MKIKIVIIRVSAIRLRFKFFWKLIILSRKKLYFCALSRLKNRREKLISANKAELNEEFSAAKVQLVYCTLSCLAFAGKNVRAEKSW